MARVPTIPPVSDLRQGAATETEVEILKRITQGEEELRSDKGYDLDDVMADAEAILPK